MEESEGSEEERKKTRGTMDTSIHPGLVSRFSLREKERDGGGGDKLVMKVEREEREEGRSNV